MIEVRHLDLMGKRFGYLTVTGQDQNAHGSTWWRCLCDCGLTCHRQGKRLTMKTRAGWVHSCGCRGALVARIQQKFHSTVDARLQAIRRG